MSRCFPYPPPGCAEKFLSNRALTLSIEEKRKPRTDQKKYKILERKENSTSNAKALNGSGTKKKLLPDGKSLYGDKQKYVKWPEEQKSSAEDLRKNSVTEEYTVVTCSLSDITRNSCNKRKKHASPTYHNIQAFAAGVIVARSYPFSLTQLDTFSSVDSGHLRMTGEPNLTSSSQAFSGSNYAFATSCGSSIPMGPVNAQVQQSLCEEYREGTEFSVHHNEKTEKKPKVLRKYERLFEWTPPPLGHLGGDDLDNDDQAWLFRGRLDTAKQFKSCKKELFQWYDGSSTLRPSAQHFNDMDIYVLPFTVPF